MDFTHQMEELARELGIDKLPEERRNKIIADFGEAVLLRTFVSLMARLSPQEREVFEAMDKSKDGASVAFFKERVSDFDTVLSDISRELISEMKSATV